MRYLVALFGKMPFLTDYYSPEMFAPESNMIVYDLSKQLFTDDGKQWKEIQIDNL